MLDSKTTFSHAWCPECGHPVAVELDHIGIPKQPELSDATDIMGKECRHVIATVYTRKP